MKRPGNYENIPTVLQQHRNSVSLLAGSEMTVNWTKNYTPREN